MSYMLPTATVDSAMRHIETILQRCPPQRTDIKAINAHRLLAKELEKLRRQTQLQKDKQ